MNKQKIRIGLFLAWSIIAGLSPVFGQQNEEPTGLPGDHFSLENALEMFKKASSPEDFEKQINTESNGVNNLDLNEDGETDYIRVINKSEGLVNIFIIQAVISEKESQDIAVIELEKTGDETAVAQIIGNEDIFGEELIVEPAGEEAAALLEQFQPFRESGPSGYIHPSGTHSSVIINVWGWPSVRFIYAPGYRYWTSPWGWRNKPFWFHPWKPLGWTYFRPVRYRYHPHYQIVNVHRVVMAPRIYHPVRVNSVTVTNRYRPNVAYYRANKKVHTRVATGPGGRTYQATRVTTTTQGKNGGVKRTTTKVKRHR